MTDDVKPRETKDRVWSIFGVLIQGLGSRFPRICRGMGLHTKYWYVTTTTTGKMSGKEKTTGNTRRTPAPMMLSAFEP